MRVTQVISGAALALSTFAVADCGKTAKEVGGNWYCSAVDKIVYNNFGTAGKYNKITSMNSDGTCQFIEKEFSGPLAPLNEQVSLHFRGPLKLKQFASYTPSSNQKRDGLTTKTRRNLGHNHGSGHARFHARQAEAAVEPVASPAEDGIKKRADMVVATIDGKVVSWVNNYFGPTTVPVPTPAPATAPIEEYKVAAVPADVFQNYKVAAPGVVKAQGCTTSSAKQAVKTTYAGTSGTVPITHSAYTRSGYYNAESQTLDGLTFLGNYGGAGSGVFDMTFGNSLSYINSAADGGAESAQILADMTVPSNKEFAIFTDKECTEATCGYSRPGAIAYEGFDGGDKIFLFEFSMPSDGSAGFNADMPAIWMLNAEIPRTLQYGKQECSCWSTGCGEFDIVEVLSSGSGYCKSTVHTNTPGGDSNYINRPTSNTMKLAVIFASVGAQARIQVLSDDVDFSTGLTSEQIASWSSSVAKDMISTFNIVVS